MISAETVERGNSHLLRLHSLVRIHTLHLAIDGSLCLSIGRGRTGGDLSGVYIGVLAVVLIWRQSMATYIVTRAQRVGGVGLHASMLPLHLWLAGSRGHRWWRSAWLCIGPLSMV